jgi:hypothetical protein
MRQFKLIAVAAGLLICATFKAQAETTSYWRAPYAHVDLQRDASYELNLKYAASIDTAITPARVLRWISSLRGQTDFGKPSSFEFQPVVHAHDHQNEIIAQFAYKF